MNILITTYILLTFIIICALSVILARDPIRSVLYLVLVFILNAILMFIIGAEFLAVLLITVYVGAIAILFLFVVMLLNLRMIEAYNSLYYHIPVGIFIGIFFILFNIHLWTYYDTTLILLYTHNYVFTNIWINYIYLNSNLSLIGEILYNYYLDLFILIGLILFGAMIGVIVLTVDYDYRTNNTRISTNNSNTREILEDTISSNITIISKDRQYTWHKLFKAGNTTMNYKYVAQPYIYMEIPEPDPEFPLPKWIKKLFAKYDIIV